MNQNNLSRRYFIFLIGIIFNAIGVAITTSANLGTTPISSLPYVLSLAFPYSFGAFTFVFNILLVLGQAALLRKEFQKIQYLQIAATFVFSFFIDMTMLVMNLIPNFHYIQQFAFLIIGCAMLGIGICLEVYANVMYIPGEGLVKAITHRLDKEFGVIKVCFDVSLVTAALVTSIICMDEIAGLREGTIFGALTVGLMARFFIKRLKIIEKWINTEPASKKPADNPMSQTVLEFSTAE